MVKDNYNPTLTQTASNYELTEVSSDEPSITSLVIRILESVDSTNKVINKETINPLFIAQIKNRKKQSEEIDFPFSPEEIEELINYSYGICPHLLDKLGAPAHVVHLVNQEQIRLHYNPGSDSSSYFSKGIGEAKSVVELSEGVLKHKYKLINELNSAENIGLTQRECLEIALAWLIVHEQIHIVQSAIGNLEFRDQLYFADLYSGSFEMHQNFQFSEERHAEGFGVLAVEEVFEFLINVRRKLYPLEKYEKPINEDKRDTLVRKVFNWRIKQRSYLLRIAELEHAKGIKLKDIIDNFIKVLDSVKDKDLISDLWNFNSSFYQGLGRCLPYTKQEIGRWIRVLK